MRIQSVSEKREDDAGQAWGEYLKTFPIAYNGAERRIAKQAFIAGYLAGREDGKIGV